MSFEDISSIVELYEDDDAFEIGHQLEAHRNKGDALSSFTKTIRLLGKSFIRRKENYLLESILLLDHEDSNGISDCGMDNDEYVPLNPSSASLAKEFVSYVASEMTTPNVNKDSRGCICFEWGTVYGKYMLIRFSGQDTYTVFWQRSNTSEVQKRKYHRHEMLGCQKVLPWRM